MHNNLRQITEFVSKTLKVFLSKGRKYLIDVPIIFKQDMKGYSKSKLVRMSKKGKYKKIKKICEKGYVVDFYDKEGKTALMWAAQNGKFETVKELIEVGADVNIYDLEGRTALIWAIIGFEQLMVKNDFLFNKHDRLVKLEESYSKIFDELIQSDLNLSHQDEAGKTAIMWSIEKMKYHMLSRRNETVKKLIKASPNVDIVDINGDTAVMYAVKYTNLEIIKELIKKGCKLDISNKEGNTALIMAMKKEQHFKVWNSKNKLVPELLEGGANPNIRGQNGNTALHMGIKLDSLRMIKVLLQYGALTSIEDNMGITPYDLAVKLGCKEILNEFEKSNFNVQNTELKKLASDKILNSLKKELKQLYKKKKSDKIDKKNVTSIKKEIRRIRAEIKKIESTNIEINNQDNKIKKDSAM